MLGEVVDLLLGDDAGLQLREERRDCLQRIELFGQPFAVAGLAEGQRTGRHVPGEQGHGGKRDGSPAGALVDIALVVGICRLRVDHLGRLEVFGLREHGVGVGEIHHTERVWVGIAWRPLGDEDRRADRVVVVAQEAEVHAQVANQVAEHPLADRGRVRRRRRHQFGGSGGDQVVQRARHFHYRSFNGGTGRAMCPESRIRPSAGLTIDMQCASSQPLNCAPGFVRRCAGSAPMPAVRR